MWSLFSLIYLFSQARNGLNAQLIDIQSRLLDLGSHVATPQHSSTVTQLARTEFSGDHALALEQWIDVMDTQLAPLKNFILPSGGLASTQLHICRTVCRRAERYLVPLILRGDALSPAGVYLNRLSDYLFVAARFAAQKEGQPDIVYRKGFIEERFVNRKQRSGNLLPFVVLLLAVLGWLLFQRLVL